MDVGAGVLTGLAIGVYRLGHRLGLIEAFGARLVYLGFLIFGGLSGRGLGSRGRLLALLAEYLLGAFYHVVGSLLRGLKGGAVRDGIQGVGGGLFGALHYAAVRYGVGGVGSGVFHGVGSGRGGVGNFIQ